MATMLQVKTDARPESVPALRNLVAQLARDKGFSDEEAYAIKTCVGEAAANAALHAYPKSQPGSVKSLISPRKTVTWTVCARSEHLSEALLLEGPGADLSAYAERRAVRKRLADVGTIIEVWTTEGCVAQDPAERAARNEFIERDLTKTDLADRLASYG